ncbi:hypothetical protein [Allostreptomyces psammosilenae]|uniref:DUF3592 domain-containing protein n=1 Tax=Allostreptomyces psammosilenae TaxID=1892865 RepID=A0A852ZYV9_9ACTN|nr:hypothetical protein [Allostreptomyces psammosilenae]NYI03791.1 hypothetical protein [Allostreptomyces psammosilenae]
MARRLLAGFGDRLERWYGAVLEAVVEWADRLTEEYSRRGWRWLALDVAVAVGVPLLAVGLAYGGAWLNAHGPGWPSEFLGNVVLFVGFALGFFSCVLYLRSERWFFTQFLVGAVSGLLLALVVNEVAGTVARDVMRSRGQSTTCEVLDVEVQVRTSNSYDSQGRVVSTSTTTYYVHRLDCAAGRPDEMTLGASWGGPGDRIRVTYDPRGRLDPRPTELVEQEGGGPNTLARVAFASAVALRLGYVTVAFAGRRRRRRQRRR